MPAMLGLHPYFPRATLATVAARTRTVWLTDAQALPVQEVMTPAEWSFDRPRLASRVGLDHCFDHWDGAASVSWPDQILNMTATGCRALHVYTPPDTDFFCLEPQTAAAGALNRASGEGAELASGQRLEIKLGFTVRQA
jgi:aldose 1-epimerase